MGILVEPRSLKERGLTPYNYLITLNLLKEPVFALLRELNGGITPAKYLCKVPIVSRHRLITSKPCQWFEIDPWNGVLKFMENEHDPHPLMEEMRHLHWEFAKDCLTVEVKCRGH